MQAKELVVATPVPSFWEVEREAIQAAAFVAAFVGAPAVVAVGAVLFMFALTWLVLVAPLVVPLFYDFWDRQFPRLWPLTLPLAAVTAAWRWQRERNAFDALLVLS